MKRSRLVADPIRAAERRQRREQRRASELPRPEDLAREARRMERQTAKALEAGPTRKPTVTKVATKRRPISEASPAQRAAVAPKGCLVCGKAKVDPAHLIPRSLVADKDGDPRAVVPLCRTHHRLFDEGGLDLLPYLEAKGCRAQLAFAVERFGLLATVRRVTNSRDYGSRP